MSDNILARLADLGKEAAPAVRDPKRGVKVAPKYGDPARDHLRNRAADLLDEWTATVMRNMKRMATDEAYRLSIAKYLS